MENLSRIELIKKRVKELKSRILVWYLQQPKKTLYLKAAGGLFSLGLLTATGFILLIRFGAFGALPTKEELKNIKNDTSSEVYSEDGVLLGKYFVENRTNVSFEEISPDIINALIATEDARFFEHKGVDLRAFFRVAMKSVLLQDESAGGGSTLSQQLAKNLFPRQQHHFFSVPINKFREMFIARRLEQLYSKDELLNLYLNTVPFGRNIFGVQVAAKQFFNTSAQDLKTEDAAVLVGMLKGNSYYDPVNFPERALARRNVVLLQMKKYEYLEETACDSLQKLPLQVQYRTESSNEGLATYFREYLRPELVDILKNIKKPDGSSYNLYTDGLRVYTTINSSMQRYAEEAVAETLLQLQKDFDKHWQGRKMWGSDKIIEELMIKSSRYQKLAAAGWTKEQIAQNFEKEIPMTIFSWEGDKQTQMSPVDSIKYYFAILNAGFLAMNQYTGEIKAWVGGINHKYFKYDHVKSKRQVGSTFKPVVYAQALLSGIQPCDYIDNTLVTYPEYENWTPQNSDGKYGGVYSMAGGLTHSVNSIAVDLIIRTGVDKVRDLAFQMGVASDIPNGPAIALGAVDISLYDMARVYSTFASRGIRPTPIYLTAIETADGKVLAKFENKPQEFRRILPQETADIMIHMMESVVDSGTAQRLRYHFNLPNAIAGKTGTTQSQADGWFMGFTPNLVAGAWVGGEYPSVRFRSQRLGQGANTALPIWGRFMKKVNADPVFRKMRRDTFAGVSEDMAMLLDCPHFLEERPLLADDLFNEFGDSISLDIKRLLDIFRKDKNLEEPSDGSNRRPRPLSKDSERIRKQNEKLKKKRERQKKRKEFFDKIFDN